jgi:hypothetical protein
MRNATVEDARVDLVYPAPTAAATIERGPTIDRVNRHVAHEAELRMLQSRSAPEFARGNDLLIRMHILLHVRRDARARQMPELRRGIRAQARPSRGGPAPISRDR